jgi:hypothetical protein
LNRCIVQFEYTEVEARDKPQPIDKLHLTKGAGFSQSAASMKLLVTLLPFMIGDKIPVEDQHWINYLHLLQVTILCLSPSVSQRTVDTLRQKICHYLVNFQKLHPNKSFTPKMHYLCHMPDQILMFGPPRMHWCMRFEAKHSLFKFKRWFNFKNVAKSLAEYHQN